MYTIIYKYIHICLYIHKNEKIHKELIESSTITWQEAGWDETGTQADLGVKVRTSFTVDLSVPFDFEGM